MKRYQIIIFTLLWLIGMQPGAFAQQGKRAPNIIYILSDDLNWGDLSCYGQQLFKTPHIDRIANEGIRFTQAYAGSAVCAPSRSCLMQGKHSGHARVCDNMYKGYRESLQPGDFTVASLLQKAGYKTGIFGKWGLSNHDQPGLPNHMGFDEFFGYLNQQHAHTYYPEFLYHNKERVYFPGNNDHFKLENYAKPSPYDAQGKVIPNGMKDPDKGTYAFDIYADKSLDFVRNHKDHPFFLYLAYTLPHGQLIVPDLGEFNDKDWPIQYKEYAAMVTRMDAAVGELLALLKELDLDENTIIFFASDNGNPSGTDRRYQTTGHQVPPLNEFFNVSAPTRGGKGDTYDGAFRVPAMVRWPGHIAPKQVSDQIWAFWDFMPTAAELAGVEPPKDIDGLSILPTLLNTGEQKQHDYLYWEYAKDQIVRSGKWLAHRKDGGRVELYDLPADPAQATDLSAQFPDETKRFRKIMDASHEPSDVWPSPGETEADFQGRLKRVGAPERPNNRDLY